MKVQKIHENFRRFLLNENIDPNDVCMYHHGVGKQTQRIILYKPVQDSDIQSRLFLDTVIIGAVRIDNTQAELDTPCIPETFQISSIFTHQDYEGQGFQKLLMDCAFYVLGQQGKGLTSDQDHGTTPAATRAWRKIDASGEYEKRKTAQGNDEFDYNNRTPDPDDDCNLPRDITAVSTSYKKNDTSNIQPQYDKMNANHEQYLKKIDRVDRSAFRTMLVNKSISDFTRRYHGL